MLDLLPPEILGRVLETGVEAFGLGFLPPICLVSRTCNDVVISTPSVWGIVVATHKACSWPVLHQQLAKAKAADLNVTVRRKGWRVKGSSQFIAELVALARNWVQADVETNLLARSRRAELARLEVLKLSFHGGAEPEAGTADDFFAESSYMRTNNLHSFTASRLPDEWVTRFLSPRISYFKFGGSGYYEQIPTSRVHHYLTLIPNVHTLHLENMSFPPFSASNSVVILSELHNLELDDVRNATLLLLDLRAPALRVLSIRKCTPQMSLLFSDWSQPAALPARLQTLELAHCLDAADIPYLIGWLSRLPSLLRLILASDYDLDEAGRDLLRAFAQSTETVASPLCPSLIHLCLDMPVRMDDILPIARARRYTLPQGPLVPLRSMQAQLCASGSPEEVAELRSCFAEPEEVRCLCLSCSFNIALAA